MNWFDKHHVPQDMICKDYATPGTRYIRMHPIQMKICLKISGHSKSACLCRIYIYIFPKIHIYINAPCGNPESEHKFCTACDNDIMQLTLKDDTNLMHSGFVLRDVNFDTFRLQLISGTTYLTRLLELIYLTSLVMHD